MENQNLIESLDRNIARLQEAGFGAGIKQGAKNALGATKKFAGKVGAGAKAGAGKAGAAFKAMPKAGKIGLGVAAAGAAGLAAKKALSKKKQNKFGN